VTEISYRQARLDDAGEIHALLLRLAPEIPLLVDTLEREEALYALVRNCARSGESLVACDAAGRIVGFVLVEPNLLGRHYAENEVLDLRHAGVVPECRNAGVFTGLIGQLLARMLPVATRVGIQNRSHAAERLERLGFRRTDAAGGEHRLLWQPGASA
jgi:N-acetylglutamate synthase-like GNAT family acetyltransferase